MSRVSRSKQQARERERAQRAYEREQDLRGDRGAFADPDPVGLLDAAVFFAESQSTDKSLLSDIAEALGRYDKALWHAQLRAHVADLFDAAVDRLFENGWQPAELNHYTRKEAGPGGAGLLSFVFTAHTARTSAFTTAPETWTTQLLDLNIGPGSANSRDEIARWSSAFGTDPTERWCTMLALLAFLRAVGPMQILVPTPSRWGSLPLTASSKSVTDSKVLTKIRGLLAKAESTQFPAEAELFSAKAQDLMTRYAIATAVLDAGAKRSLVDDVISRRIMVDAPYPEAKMQLLHSVSMANGAKTMSYKRYGLISIVGLPVDLDLCELLYTSLLVQSSTAMAEVSGTRQGRSRSFRRSFLIAYAYRVGERLVEARIRAAKAASEQYGSALVPILTERSDAVSSAFAAFFPSTSKTKVVVTNAAGSHAGRAAAERADLTGGRGSLDEADLAS